jgi:dTDP-4-amino-4,6-dideoxygalactose transaminase
MIPFNRPVTSTSAHSHLARAVCGGHHSGDGAYTKLCHRLLEARLPGSKALLTTSCTHALEMAALLLNIEAGDEVIAPSFTFVSTVNAFALRGARIVFGDIRDDTLNLDERCLESLISPRTKAIVPVHYAGVGCEMDAIMAIANGHGIPVVEDNAHGLFGSYRGQALGTFGAVATQSFHETKNISCGEGGALMINDPSLIERAEIIREKGTNRSRFFRGQVDKYSWVDLGSSFLPSDLLAAVLCGNLESADEIQARRHSIWATYDCELGAWADRHGIRRPFTPPHCEHPAHMYYLRFRTLDDRTAFIAHLADSSVKAVFHYLPLHVSEFGERYGCRSGSCPITERTSDELVRLPLFFDLSDEELTRVIEACLAFTPPHGGH